MFKQALDRRAAQDRPIQVGFVGAGRMGTGAICQIGLMKGIRNAIIVDISTERVVRAFELCGHRREDVVSHQFGGGRGGRHPKRQAGRRPKTRKSFQSSQSTLSSRRPEIRTSALASRCGRSWRASMS